MIISRVSEPAAKGAPSRVTERLVAGSAIVLGIVAWAYYANQDLILAHYDAKAHLVVARRVIDSVTPGWRQIGAVWLPLPHLVQLLPTQVDWLYRTGAFASLVSISCFGILTWATARLALLTTQSHLAAATSAALIVLNPNLLYLQATPMTELMLLALTSLSVLRLYEWLTRLRLTASARQAPLNAPSRGLGWLLFATAWTRYEAWAILGALLALTVWVMWRIGISRQSIAVRTWQLARWPAAAVALFLVISRLTVGAWFVSGGFYEIDPTYDGHVLKSVIAVWWGTHRLSGYVVESIALLTAAFVIGRSLMRRSEASTLVTAAVFAAAALPALLFFEAHPFRVRYMVPMVSACALFGGMAVGMIGPRGGPYVLSLILIASSLIESPPWRTNAPLILEAQLDASNAIARRAVTSCLAPSYRGEKVLASMGSLAHYMQELSREGFALSEFVHEGNGVLWGFALETGAAAHVGWMLVEEESEGGDVLARQIREHPSFTSGMARVCEGGGVALYRRD